MSPRPSSTVEKGVYGRGGAGNRGSVASSGDSDLNTPTIKNNIYTTGRGGVGNLKMNHPTNPEMARHSQDVKGVTRKYSETRSHVGRGGAANITRQPSEEVVITNAGPSSSKSQQRAAKHKGGAEKESKNKMGDWWRDALMDGKESGGGRT